MPQRHTGVMPQCFIPLALVFSLVWSSAFVVGALAVPELGPMLTLVARFGLSALLMLPLCLLRRGHGLTDRATVRAGLGLGVLNNAVYLGLTFEALRYTTPALVVVCVSLAPFMTGLLAALAGQERFTWRNAAGLALGLAGVTMITGPQVGSRDLYGIGLALLGTLAFAGAATIFRRQAAALPLLPTNFWQSLAGFVALLPLAWVDSGSVTTASAATVAAVVYLALGVSIGGMLLWFLLIRVGGAGRAAAVHLMNPIFGLGLSHLAFGSPITLRAIGGCVMVATGLAVALRAGSAATR